MSYKPFQLLKKHSTECCMLNGLNGDQPWSMPETVYGDGSFGKEQRVGRDLAGRRNRKARHSWLLFHCSDPECPAELAVYWPHAEMQLKLSADEWKEQAT